MKYSLRNKILLTLGVLTFGVALPTIVNPNSALAEGIIHRNADKVHFGTPFGQLPKEVQKLIPDPPPDGTPWRINTGGYDQGQCTWYVYERAKVRGRTYTTTEGNGGEWYKDMTSYGSKTGTTGDTKPIPQTTISMFRANSGTSDTEIMPANEASDLWTLWHFTTHIQYCEYIDEDGYLLISESNVRGQTSIVYYNILTPDQAQNHNLHYTKPLNWQSIPDWGKNPDGTLPKDAGSAKPKNDEGKSNKSEGKKSSSNTDDTFTVNGYGSITAKDFQEANVGDKLPTQQDIDAMSPSQKQVLMEWIADNDSSTQGSIIKYTRQGIVLLGYLLVLFTLLLALAYAFDRVGVLEFSAVEFITGGNYTTTYTHEQAQELKHSNTGVKPMNMQALGVVTFICIVIFVLIVTGKLYYYAYSIYTFVYNLSDYMNNIRPK